MKLPSIPINLHTRSRAKFGPKMGTGSFSMRVWHLPIALGYQTFSGRADRNEALRVVRTVRTLVGTVGETALSQHAVSNFPSPAVEALLL